ncbi:HU family DNA-binding protein [Nakamurella endophytica]|uniref:HU family DNA-binding protein n=1 Tax=Nakamurella endophytica TaxID=1748367 RepID=A0A917SLL8_9ACTN|nr:HU family DNA-binding protein [Nakamurella endophytica]GGL84998.1 hypothetical protein GCM10011594_00730 [Nakamurella endophytica]
MVAPRADQAYRVRSVGPVSTRGRNRPEETVNKTDLINQLAERLNGDKKAAQIAVEGFIDLVQREVHKGENVSISGFGVFEKRVRAARTARNPRTGESVKVKKTTVPAFRPGKWFKDVISGAVKMPKPTGKPTSARASAAAAKAAATTPRTRRSTAAAASAAPAAAPAATTTAPKTTRARSTAAAKSTAEPKSATTTAAKSTRAASGTKAAAAEPKTTRTRSTATKAAAEPKTAASTRAPRASAGKSTTTKAASKKK